MNPPLKVLLVEDNPAHCLLFTEFIRLQKEEPIEVLNASTLGAATDLLHTELIDVIVLDLYLPDSEGLDTFHTISSVSGAIPIIILSGLKDSTIALAAIKQGAQDYLVKGDYNEKILLKTLHYSIERKKIEEKLRLTQEKLAHEQVKHQQLLTEKAIEIQERERAQLGRELHDNITQLLTSARICFGTALLNEANRVEMLKAGIENLGTAMAEIRKMSHDLTPPSLGNIGLKDAVQDIIGPILAAHPIKIRSKIDVLHVSPAVQLMLYRIIQEQLQNIIKYASASYVLITVKETEKILKLEISDNGIGFDPQVKTEGIGLRNIKSRAQVHGGTAEIVSSPGNGCTVRLTIPVNKIKTT